MVAEEMIITLSGGAPWGFRLQGGMEHQKPLQVAKVRKRSKACRAGLREGDELVSINEHACGRLSHAQAMNLIDTSTGILHIQVKRAPAGFQSVVLVTRAPSPRIDKEYRAALRAISPTHLHHAPVREVHRSRSSLTSGLTSPPGSEAYYGETDSDADVAGYERQRRQKRRSPSNSNPGKPSARASPEGGETSEMSGYDSAPDECGPHRHPLMPPPSSPQAKEALMLGSHSQLVPMVGPVNKPIDEELTTTYMEKAKQAKLNRGETLQDKHVKEAKSKCRTIASLLTDAPNPHSKGVLMFKKRRQRSKRYTLTSFGSVDEDRCQDSQEEDGVFPGSESEFDEDGFLAVPDPTWDSDYLQMLEKRATAGTEGRGDGAEDTPSPGLSDTAGKGVHLFEQQRKRAVEHAKKVEAAHAASMVMPPPPVAPKPDTASVTILTSSAQTTETPLPELPNSNVLNRTARPFTPGFISNRAVTAPVTFRPPVTKMSQGPALAAVVPPPFSTASELVINPTLVTSQLPPGPLSVISPPSSVPQGPLAPTPEPCVTFHPSAVSSSVETIQLASSVTAVHQAPFVTVPPVSIPSIQAASLALMGPAPISPTPVPDPTVRTGILLEARRRSGKVKSMFNVPDIKKNSPNPELLSMVQNLDDRSTRHKCGQPPTDANYDALEEEQSGEAGMGRLPPPVAPKPWVIHEAPSILQAGGKGAQLFARRQSHMGMYVVDTLSEIPYQQKEALQSASLPLQSSFSSSLPSQWKYSPNVRAPPPIGYNPLQGPSIPTGPQRDTSKPDSKGRGGSLREGIKALDFMRRQPYQLSSALFNYGGSATNVLAMPSYQIPIKTARVYEIKRFSTPTPMSATTLVPKVIAPRSATTLGERFAHSAKQFQSAPELSILVSLPPLKSNPVQAPKPHFVATKGGVQPRVWRPGAI
uniref:Synaptopodin 2-like protein n=1 Tax=Scophthalmus maximus TaxID=52904 RepID=A0A8D3B7U1_SCOMX